MNEEYYILENGNKKGPYTFKELISEGVDLDTQILEPGSDTWQSASYLPKFSEYFESLGFIFPTEDNLASPGLRTLAFIIDYIIIAAIAATVVFKTGLIKLPETTGIKETTAFMESLGTRTELLAELIFVAIFLIYNMISEVGRMRGSVGKRICGLKVVDADGKSLSIVKSLVHSIGAVTGFSPIGAIIVIISFFIGTHRQTWYERITNTFVISN